MQKEIQQWLAVQSKQQAELADIGVGLFDITVQGVADLCELNFGAARRQLAHTSEGLAAMTSPEQLPAAMQKVAEQAISDVQAYMQQSADLLVRLHQQSQALVADHFKLVQASADTLIDQTQKLSPGASEVVSSALRSWVDGAQSAVVQMNQMSTQFSDFAGNNRAVAAVWQNAKAPARSRSNGKSAS